MSSRYLVRFDDLCPTMNWDVWNRVERAMLSRDVRPLLAVVPDNQDPHLTVQPARADFWEQVRMWQRRGWTIALHGYQHRYVNQNSGIIGRNAYSEFAGLSEREQEQKIEAGLRIFAREGVRADAWVAPAHSFDHTTLTVLARHGITNISDGYALRPYADGEGRVWTPQQIGRFIDMPGGVWTVCMHFNSWTDADIVSFETSLQRYQGRIIRFADAVREGETRKASWADSALATSLRTVRRVRSVIACA
ncbi:hypothetical protein F183_A16520 [Bryobacterales bacterium F-183]|nr:hypothetical protein F183_A16520 [Bryobacterales bacterium F-183]